MAAPWQLILLVLAFVLFVLAGFWWRAEPAYHPHRFSVVCFGLASLVLAQLVGK